MLAQFDLLTNPLASFAASTQLCITSCDQTLAPPPLIRPRLLPREDYVTVITGLVTELCVMMRAYKSTIEDVMDTVTFRLACRLECRLVKLGIIVCMWPSG